MLRFQMSDVPFAAVKMALFEGFVWAYREIRKKNRLHQQQFMDCSDDPLHAVEVAGIGIASGASTALITCPIDVVNTHIKAGLVEVSKTVCPQTRHDFCPIA